MLMERLPAQVREFVWILKPTCQCLASVLNVHSVLKFHRTSARLPFLILFTDANRFTASVRTTRRKPQTQPSTSTTDSNVPATYTQRSCTVHTTFPQRSHSVPALFIHFHNVPTMFPQYTHNIPRTFTHRSNVSTMFPQHSRNVP